jgi:macrolide transport system ATP-binding/permease protein
MMFKQLWTDIRVWFLALFGRSELHSRTDEEIQFHLAMRQQRLIESGVPPADARRQARRQLGNATLIAESSREAWGWLWLERLGQDLRYAFRTMASNRLFTLLAVISLALGIGANTAIYSFMDSILLRALPVSNPASLVLLNWHSQAGERRSIAVIHGMDGYTYPDPKLGIVAPIFPYPAFELLQKENSAFSAIFAFHPAGPLSLSIKGQADVANGEYVSGDYFGGLGIVPAAGRMILPDDDRAGAPAVAVVSMALCQRRFGEAANAAGQSILINNVPFTIVGVAPPEFFGVDPAAAPDFYLPIHSNLLLGTSNGDGGAAADYLAQNDYWIQIGARLRPGISLAQAQAALVAPFHHWVESTAATDRERANLPELMLTEGAGGLDTLRRQYSQPLYVLMTLVGLILTIACANIANLLLARAAVRRREIALRLSVGASRLRVVRQLLTESVLLASLGGTLGIMFAMWGTRFLTLLLANGNANFTLHADLNWHVLGVAAALSVLTGVVFGLAPALQATRTDVMPALKNTLASQARSRFGLKLSHVLVVSQIALLLLILVAAGLFVRTLQNLQSVALGFNRENLLLFQLNARQAGHRDPEIASFYSDLQNRFSSIPGVRRVSLSHRPLFAASTSLPMSVSGVPADGHPLFVGPAFLTTMEVPMLEGREIEDGDRPGSPPVAVVSESFAKANFGNQSPVGRHLTLGSRAPLDLEIIGVSKDARSSGLKRSIPPVVYIPYHLQPPTYPLNQMFYALRTTGDPLAYVNTIREIVHQADPLLPVTNIQTQAAQIDRSINQEITFANLCTAFGILALVIASVGLYGTMSYTIARRTGEIGLRMALGAQRGGVVWMVLREVLLLVALGLAIGIPAAFAASRLVASFLFGMKPNDPLALLLAVAILLCAAIVAGWVPARRASRTDPMIALRQE